jgi:predicted porin
MGNIDLMANFVTVKDKAARATDAKIRNGQLMGLGANYNLSKRTMAYVRYETYDYLRNDDAAGKKTTTAFGIRHQF